MTKQFDGVEAEKAEAMRRYNNKKRLRNIVRAAALAFFCYLWFPTVAVSSQAACGWFYRTGAVIATNRTFVFFSVNILVAMICLLSRDHGEEESRSVGSNETDLYDQYTSFSAVTVAVTASDEKAVDVDDTKKQIVLPTVIAEVEEVADKQIVIAEEEEVVVEAAAKTDLKRIIRRTKSERKKKVKRQVATEFRRTESANSGIERLSSEEFRLKVEKFIMEKKRSLVQEENGVAEWREHGSSGLELVGADSSYASC